VLLKLQNKILEMIASGKPLEKTLDSLCRTIERMVPTVTCSILLVDGQGRLHPAAGPKLEAIDGIKIGPDVGSCGSAAYYRKPVAVSDIATDPRCDAYRHLVAPLGFKACWSVPILRSDKTVAGTLAFYFLNARMPTPEEKKAAAASVHLCSIAIERQERVTERQRLAYSDHMTALPNRAAFELELGRVVREHRGLLLLDLDNLKIVNDGFGHQAGDALISQTAARLGAMFRSSYRIGGDEFAIICAAKSPKELSNIAHRILETLSAPAACMGQTIAPLATIGGVLCGPGEDLRKARQQADLALYHAKETCRGGYLFFDQGLASSIRRRLDAVHEVSLALSEERLAPFYQPLVELTTGRIIGAEALCRVIKSDGGVISAGQFFEGPHDARVAAEITTYMLQRIGTDLIHWKRCGYEVRHIGINVTAADFHAGSLDERLRKVAFDAGLENGSVIVEVTESVYLEQRAERIRSELAALRRAGFRIALDDFGTGYAALTHLLEVPVDIIKIDKSFVSRMQREDGALAIVQGLVSIAARMGMKVIAEGVETEWQATALRLMGCDYAQGFRYAPAVRSHEFLKLLEEERPGVPPRVENRRFGIC
jgi:diguanylate cyclase (GGDEF)-like protein